MFRLYKTCELIGWDKIIKYKKKAVTPRSVDVTNFLVVTA